MTEILEIRKRNALWIQSMSYIVSCGRIKGDIYAKYVREMRKIHKTEWTEIRGWKATFKRVTSHLSRGSTQWAGRMQGELVRGRSSYHRHSCQHHIKHVYSHMYILTKTTNNERSTCCCSSCSPQWHPQRWRTASQVTFICRCRAPPCACNLVQTWPWTRSPWCLFLDVS